MPRRRIIARPDNIQSSVPQEEVPQISAQPSTATAAVMVSPYLPPTSPQSAIAVVINLEPSSTSSASSHAATSTATFSLPPSTATPIISRSATSEIKKIDDPIKNIAKIFFAKIINKTPKHYSINVGSDSVRVIADGATVADIKCKEYGNEKSLKIAIEITSMF